MKPLEQAPGLFIPASGTAKPRHAEDALKGKEMFYLYMSFHLYLIVVWFSSSEIHLGNQSQLLDLPLQRKAMIISLSEPSAFVCLESIKTS